MNKLIVLVGPTSSGKTSLAVELCKQLDREIISADSRQIYKEMDIGTGKVPVNSNSVVEKKEDHWILDDVVTWGYDLVNLNDYFTAYDYALWAISKVKEAEQSKLPILVGGTGFYVDVITGRKTVAGAKPDHKLRESLETTPTKNLVTWLTSLNPKVSERIDLSNRVRVIRALEVELAKEKNSTPLPRLKNTEFIQIGLTAPNKFLYERVDKWLDIIWQNGLIEETKYLMQKYPNSRLLHGLVYKSAVSFINGETEEEAIQRAKFDLHSYIRRQLTWFRANKDINWFDITDPSFGKKVSYHVESKLDG